MVPLGDYYSTVHQIRFEIFTENPIYVFPEMKLGGLVIMYL